MLKLSKAEVDDTSIHDVLHYASTYVLSDEGVIRGRNMALEEWNMQLADTTESFPSLPWGG